jgi:hypothetical protein
LITSTISATMPVFDSPLDAEVADGLGNDLLLGVAAGAKTQKVSGTTPRGIANQSGESRAWTSAGNVD